MALLIDGYNLLHASGVFPARHLPGTLHHARTALLDELVTMLPERELRQTTIVFDSAEAPPGLPNRINFQGLDVRFASDHADADELIEILIDESLSPRELVVVSSDHRLHRAARRRRATPMDSDVWFIGLQAMQHLIQEERASAKPQHQLSEGEVNFWLKAFGAKAGEGEAKVRGKPQASAEATAVTPKTPAVPSNPKTDLPAESIASEETNSDAPASGAYNPFPPGYCDDLFEEE
jgi:uncharacterized protein